MKDKAIKDLVFIIFLVVLAFILALVFANSAGAQEPEDLDICVEPGNPVISSWKDIYIKVLWPCGRQNRVDEYMCFLVVLTPAEVYREAIRLELYGAPGPEVEHVVLTAFHAFGNRPGTWTALDGSCFSLKDGVVHYSKPISGLPLDWRIRPAYRVFLPTHLSNRPTWLGPE
jgi:hypothetical protein